MVLVEVDEEAIIASLGDEQEAIDFILFVDEACLGLDSTIILISRLIEQNRELWDEIQNQEVEEICKEGMI